MDHHSPQERISSTRTEGLIHAESSDMQLTQQRLFSAVALSGRMCVWQTHMCNGENGFSIPDLFNRNIRDPLSVFHFLHNAFFKSFTRAINACLVITYLPLFFVFLFPSACEKDVQKVCANSSEEHLQPFKEKMEAFISSGKSGSYSFYLLQSHVFLF